MVTTTKRKSNYAVIDSEKCKGCHLCIVFCPKEVLKPASHINRMGYTPAEVNEGKAQECTGCGICALMCPDIAITVHRVNKV
jgi:2-oxoglutarate ferredoxin oxidoreductase subunit delta